MILAAGVLAWGSATALAAAPKVISESAPSFNASEARLEALVNPENEITECHFQYGKTLVTENEAQCEQPVIEGGEQGVGLSLTGLTKTTTYHYRIVLKNLAAEEAVGPTQTFTTATPPQTPKTEAATVPTATTVTLHGELNPTGEAETGWHFLYSTEPKCAEGASEAPGEEVKKVPAKTKEHLTVTELQPNKKYTFCLVATNSAGEAVQSGNEVSFETKVAAPSIAAPPSTSITPTEARLEGLVNPNNKSTECHVQYGTDASLATKTTMACEPETLEGYGYQGSLTLSGLTQATTYYYRVIAKNATGEEKGTIEHLTTGTPEPPTGEEAKPVTATEATLRGVLNPRHAGEAGTYEFVYRKSATECQGGEPGEEKKAPEPAETATGHSPEPVEATITGLLPGMPYTFCLIAKNAAEEAAVGTPVTFTTLAVAPTITSESVSTVEATAATLEAEIDSGGASTTYHFEYLTEAHFNANGGTFSGATTTPQSASIGTDDTAHSKHPPPPKPAPTNPSAPNNPTASRSRTAAPTRWSHHQTPTAMTQPTRVSLPRRVLPHPKKKENSKSKNPRSHTPPGAPSADLPAPSWRTSTSRGAHQQAGAPKQSHHYPAPQHPDWKRAKITKLRIRHHTSTRN
jgi:hypothetical protein